MPKVELTIPLGVSHELYAELGQAIAEWLAIADTAKLTRPVQLILDGGAYLCPDDAAAFWDVILVNGAVVDVLVDGKSCRRSQADGRRNTAETMHNAATHRGDAPPGL